MRTNPKHPQTIGLAVLALFASLALPSGSESQEQPSRMAAPTLKAIEIDDPGGQILSFRHRGTTEVLMRGTKIEPLASVRLKVESRPGFVEIDINRGDIKGIQRARRFGRDFLTYVLWAVSVDGEAMNLGEITFEGGSPVSVNVTTPYQTFWLMVTAEPDFAVNDPSPVVVLYSLHQDNIQTPIKALPVPGKLLFYTYYSRYDTTPAEVVMNVPNELLQARKAIELASKAGILGVPTPAGEEALPDEERTRQTLEQARKYLQQAEENFTEGGSTPEAIQFARTAVQIAENARALALGAVGGIYVRQLDRDLNKLRAEAERLRAEVARLSTEGAPLREEMAKLRAALEEADKKLAAAQSELANSQRELANSKQEVATLQGRYQQLEASLDQERRRTKDLETQLLALRERVGLLEQQLSQASSLNTRLAEDRDKICAELRRQLASLGQLTQQGGNMVLTLASDILFDLGSYELRPASRENLAKLAVLRLLLFPEADVRYEGHTDRVGEHDSNQWLSEQRALSVYRYFLEERLAHEPDAAARGRIQLRLSIVGQLLAMNYATARRGQAPRAELLAQLGDTVIGKGEREPVVNTEAAEERNRRVVLLFPPAQVGRVTSLCEPQSAAAPRPN